MPSLETLESFVSLVEAGRTVDAMVLFYAEHASMQENMSAPRSGKAALIRHEEAALSTVETMKATCVRPILISEDVAVVRWIFEIQDKKGKTMRFEELAYQRWAENQIIHEQFFYDPAQFR
jgi:hypothetical protein